MDQRCELVCKCASMFLSRNHRNSTLFQDGRCFTTRIQVTAVQESMEEEEGEEGEEEEEEEEGGGGGRGGGKGEGGEGGETLK